MLPPILTTLCFFSYVCQQSTDLPYTHPQSILKFVVLSGEADLNLITSGEEGTVRTWSFNTYTSSFEHIHCYEGHLRGVSGLAFNGKALTVFTPSNARTRSKQLLILLFFYRQSNSSVVGIDGLHCSRVELGDEHSDQDHHAERGRALQPGHVSRQVSGQPVHRQWRHGQYADSVRVRHCHRVLQGNQGAIIASVSCVTTATEDGEPPALACCVLLCPAWPPGLLARDCLRLSFCLHVFSLLINVSFLFDCLQCSCISVWSTEASSSAPARTCSARP